MIFVYLAIALYFLIGAFLVSFRTNNFWPTLILFLLWPVAVPIVLVQTYLVMRGLRERERK